MNILALAFFIVAAIIFLLSVVTIMKERKNKIIIGLHSQIFIINITAFILSVLAVFQQFVSQTLASVIDQFIAIFFVLVVINLAHVVIIIWDINKGKKEVTKNSITIVLLFLFIEFIILGSSWTALYFYKNSGDIILDQYKDYLYSVANSRASHIGSLILDYKNKALADSTLNLGMINCLEDIESNGGECSKEQLDEVIKERLNSKLDKIYLMVILDKNGKIVSSSDNSLVGEDWSSRQSFINHTSDGYFSDIFYDERYNQEAVEISHPIIKNGNFWGVWIIRDSPVSIYDVLQNRANLGDTGEAILINSDGLVLSPQRFTNDIFININNPNVLGCSEDFSKYVRETPTSLMIEGHNFLLAEYTNEYGKDMLGAHVVVEGPTKGLKWCVLLEISREEALSKFNKSMLEAMIFSLIIIISFTCVFIFTFDFFFQKLFKN
jgi:hypothetical protein